MYTIHGGKEAIEEELTHLAGHKDSRPVRIGNGAVDHLQLDIYGELMDSIYLAQSAFSDIRLRVYCVRLDATDVRRLRSFHRVLEAIVVGHVGCCS